MGRGLGLDLVSVRVRVRVRDRVRGRVTVRARHAVGRGHREHLARYRNSGDTWGDIGGDIAET